MNLELANAADFKRCMDAISVLIDEAVLFVKPEGLELKATDPSQISMVDFSFPKSGFKHYEVSGELSIGLDLNYLSQVMARAKSSDSLQLSLNEQKNVLQVVFAGDSRRSFRVPLMDIVGAKIPSPRIEFDAVISMPAELMADALKDAALVSTHITLVADPQQLNVLASSSKGSVENTYARTQKGVKSFEVKNSARAMFPSDYLQDMLKAAGAQSELTISLKSDAPLRLDYSVGGARITYFLAPRIESEG
ncbi:MAG: proliferating cell nuclear antigen (pcna) [Candidatus Diapherotrites archaeon]|nr:proliferating cell nuclear antigen (pcna) [Candidatus Diapherotrites archaeon]